MLLPAKVEALRGKLNLPDDPGVNSACEVALKASKVYLETVLRSLLDKVSYLDTFYISRNSTPPKDGFFRLRLSSGFVRPSPALSVMQSDSYGDQGTALSGCVLKAEQGWLLVPDSSEGKYVMALYSAGFSTGDAMPAWLSEAALWHASKALAAQQVGDGKPELSDVFKMADIELHTILGGHLRNNLPCISPMG